MLCSNFHKKTVKKQSCRYKDNEIMVQPNLAMLPSLMAKMVSEGVPVSTQNMANTYYDGIPNPSFDLPIDQLRGIDINDVWNASQDSKNSLKKAAKIHSQLNTNK